MKSNVWSSSSKSASSFFCLFNLLMGEMERTANGCDKGLLWDLHDIIMR